MTNNENNNNKDNNNDNKDNALSEGITLTAKGPRAIVSIEEAQTILAQWTNQVNNNNNNNDNNNKQVVTELDLSCRVWTVATLNVFATFFHDHVVPTIQRLRLDDIIASLPTEDGLDTLAWCATHFSATTTTTTTSTTSTTTTTLRDVELSDNAIGTRGIDRLAPLLQLPSIQSLRFNNCGLSQEVMDALLERLPLLTSSDQSPSLSSSSSLPSLRLHALALGRNQIGPVGAEHVATLLQSSRCLDTLQSFEYGGSRPLKRGTRALCQALQVVTAHQHEQQQRQQRQRNTDSNTDTTTTNNNNNPIGLTVLDLDDCDIGNGDHDDDPIHALAAALAKAPHLTKLVLNDGGLEAQGLQIILTALQTSQAKLEHWDLGAIDCGPDGAQALADWILQEDNNKNKNKNDKNNDNTNACPLKESLVFFKLDTNALTDEGLAILLPALTLCNNLQVLNLEQNELTTASLMALVQHPIPSLHTLLLQDNDFEFDDDNDDEAMDAVRTLRRMYRTVRLQEEEEDHDDHHYETTSPKKPNDDDASVDALTAAMKDSTI